MSALSERELITAHEARDYPRLVEIYQQRALEVNTTEAACFYMTFAYVYALECEHRSLGAIYDYLRENGREE